MELFKTDEQRWEFDLQVGNDSHIPTLLLVTEWCSACKSLQYTLDQNQHPYLALDIERNTLARELFDRCIAAGASRSVPKVVHGRQMIAPQKLLLAAQE
jgi:glutaredoxin